MPNTCTGLGPRAQILLVLAMTQAWTWTLNQERLDSNQRKREYITAHMQRALLATNA